MAKTESLHFLVEGKWLQDMARQGYWFEDNESYGIKLLKESLVGITDEQVMAIINGDASLVGWSICDDKNCTQCVGLNQIQMIQESDHKFKTEITKRRLWLNETNFKIGQHHIEKNLILEFIQEYIKSIIEQDAIFADVINRRVEDIKRTFFTRGSHRYPSPDYMPEKDSYEWDYIKTINNFLNSLTTTIKQQYPNFDEDEFLQGYRVIKENLSEEITPKLMKTEGSVLFIVPHPDRNYKMVGFNVPKEFLLTFIKERERGEKSMRFTMSLDIDKEKTLERYKNLTKNIFYAHEQLMHQLGLRHSETGVYPNSMVEYFLNEALLWYVYQVIYHNDDKELKKLPQEVKLQLPENHGYGIMSIDGEIIEEKHDLR